ncbi:hypothetical protein [Paenibacillus alvei]|uniref:hypothetical protein n=1 Tax=Paenibacillus alvei TaxID=44250 RepID=UPI0013DA9971|nr:hypothetical protein [Paenibacillus alvei]NEZ45454.1 hypothetical protein [Paenibacillus alvei]
MSTRKENFFHEQIEKLTLSNWNILYNNDTGIRIVDDSGEEIDSSTLGFFVGEIDTYTKRRREKEYGEDRKYPLDEFSIRRLGIEDYVLITNDKTDSYKSVFESYHTLDGIFCIEKFHVHEKNNMKHEEFSVYITPGEAKKLLKSLVGFIEKYSNEELD